MTAKTELEFGYQPSNFFEVPTTVSVAHGKLCADNGAALYTLDAPTDPVPPALLEAIEAETRHLFELRRIIV